MDAMMTNPPPVQAASAVERAIESVIDRVAEAIYGQIFEDELGPPGTIERAMYRNAAWAGLQAGMAEFHSLKDTPDAG